MGDVAQHELITKWARKKFNLPEDAQIVVEQVKASGGYCETCWYESEYWQVRQVIPGEPDKMLENFYDDFASILKEVLDFALQETK